jgi:hypothetical protein
MFDINAGLLFRPVDRPPDWPVAIATVDVSTTICGRSISAGASQVNLAWQVPDGGAFESIWSVAQFLEGDRVVVLALGTTNNEPLVDSMPDGVAVVAQMHRRT